MRGGGRPKDVALDALESWHWTVGTGMRKRPVEGATPGPGGGARSALVAGDLDGDTDGGMRMNMRIDGGTAADGGRSNNKITREFKE